MSSVFQESNEVLLQLWKQHNPHSEDYLQKQKVIQWLKDALEKTNTLQSVQDSLTDIEGLVKQYLAQIHGLDEEGLQNIALNYSQAVQFLRWLTDSDKAEQVEPLQDNKQHEDYEAPAYDQKDKQIQAKHQGPEELQNSRHEIKLQNSRASPKVNNNSSLYTQVKAEQNQANKNNSQNTQPLKKIKTQMGREDEQINQNATVSANQFSLQTLSKKYKDYLKIIFQHYCKISYATGQDPTFEQILHKTTVMTINKFMMFCKDFDIAKISEKFNRSFLVQIFKKNSECYKEMSFQQFDEVLRKIASLGFSQVQQQGDKNEDTGMLPQQMVKLLEFCQLSTARRFREKMKRLNIQYRAGPKTNAEMKVIPQGYRFKFTSNNGKSEEQVKQQIEERRQHRSQRKIILHQKNNNQPLEPTAFRKRTLSKKTERMNYAKEKELASIKEGYYREGTSQSTNAINKILSPPVLPPKRLNNLPPPPPKAVSQTPNTVNNQPTVTQTNNPNIFKKELGYAELHKMKISEGYGKKKIVLNKSMSRDEKHSFKLNSIVEEARLQVQQMPHKEPSDSLTDSIATNSRQQANRSRNYDVNKINNKMQIINQRIKRDKQIQEQLNGILDMSNDEDQFLKQHLEREKKHELINKRLSQRIQDLDKEF